MTREAKAWKEKVTHETRQALIKRPDFLPVDKKRIVIDVWVHLKRPMDADNLLKLTLDAVAAGLVVNDRWFIPRVWEMEFGAAEEYVRLVLSQEK
jgi:Holliday junction resolvase RusA-like endonuclease